MNLMTQDTSWNNIKPMLGFVSVPMMILLGGLRAVMAEQKFGRNQFASIDSINYSSSGFNLIWMTSIVTFLSCFVFWCFSTFFICFAISSFALLGLFIMFLIIFIRRFALFCLTTFLSCFAKSRFAFFGFLIFTPARFTIDLKPVFTSSVFIKFRQLFELLALRTSFCLNCLRHSRFSLNSERLCLEPVAGTYQRSACFILPYNPKTSIKF